MRDGTLGVNRAALEFGVPLTMLKDRVSGRIIGLFLIPTLVGILTYHGRRRKWDFVISCSRLGYGLMFCL